MILSHTTETCPRPPYDLTFNDENSICTYANRAVSHWISHCRRIPYFKPLVVNYDYVWNNIIYDIWSEDIQFPIFIRGGIFPISITTFNIMTFLAAC